jgi:hypothetical protein
MAAHHIASTTPAIFLAWSHEFLAVEVIVCSSIAPLRLCPESNTTLLTTHARRIAGGHSKKGRLCACGAEHAAPWLLAALP